MKIPYISLNEVSESQTIKITSRLDTIGVHRGQELISELVAQKVLATIANNYRGLLS